MYRRGNFFVGAKSVEERKRLVQRFARALRVVEVIAGMGEEIIQARVVLHAQTDGALETRYGLVEAPTPELRVAKVVLQRRGLRGLFDRPLERGRSVVPFPFGEIDRSDGVQHLWRFAVNPFQPLIQLQRPLLISGAVTDLGQIANQRWVVRVQGEERFQPFNTIVLILHGHDSEKNLTI